MGQKYEVRGTKYEVRVRSKSKIEIRYSLFDIRYSPISYLVLRPSYLLLPSCQKEFEYDLHQVRQEDCIWVVFAPCCTIIYLQNKTKVILFCALRILIKAGLYQVQKNIFSIH